MLGHGGLLQNVSNEVMQVEVVGILEQVVEILTNGIGAFALDWLELVGQ